jgi:hypothetical protein
MFWRDAATCHVRSGEDALLDPHGAFPELNIWNGVSAKTGLTAFSGMNAMISTT